MSKIGIMGGTFDPIHNGHLVLGRQAYEEYQLDEIWYMPSYQPPHKKDHEVTKASMRLAMVKLAIEGEPGFACSDFEIRGGGMTYTAKTLSSLRNHYPEHTFYFIIGADSLYEIEKWYEPEMVLKQAVILTADREYDEAKRSIKDQIAYLNSRYGADIRKLHCREMDISSTEIRQMAAEGKKLADYVPHTVEEYIYHNHLYQEADK